MALFLHKNMFTFTNKLVAMKKVLILSCILFLADVAWAQTSDQSVQQRQNPALMMLREIRINPADSMMLKQNFPQNGTVWFVMDNHTKIYSKEERDSILGYIKSVQPGR